MESNKVTAKYAVTKENIIPWVSMPTGATVNTQVNIELTNNSDESLTATEWSVPEGVTYSTRTNTDAVLTSSTTGTKVITIKCKGAESGNSFTKTCTITFVGNPLTGVNLSVPYNPIVGMGDGQRRVEATMTPTFDGTPGEELMDTVWTFDSNVYKRLSADNNTSLVLEVIDKGAQTATSSAIKASVTGKSSGVTHWMQVPVTIRRAVRDSYYTLNAANRNLLAGRYTTASLVWNGTAHDDTLSTTWTAGTGDSFTSRTSTQAQLNALSPGLNKTMTAVVRGSSTGNSFTKTLTYNVYAPLTGASLSAGLGTVTIGGSSGADTVTLTAATTPVHTAATTEARSYSWSYNAQLWDVVGATNGNTLTLRAKDGGAATPESGTISVRVTGGLSQASFTKSVTVAIKRVPYDPETHDANRTDGDNSGTLNIAGTEEEAGLYRALGAMGGALPDGITAANVRPVSVPSADVITDRHLFENGDAEIKESIERYYREAYGQHFDAALVKVANTVYRPHAEGEGVFAKIWSVLVSTVQRLLNITETKDAYLPLKASFTIASADIPQEARAAIELASDAELTGVFLRNVELFAVVKSGDAGTLPGSDHGAARSLYDVSGASTDRYAKVTRAGDGTYRVSTTIMLFNQAGGVKSGAGKPYVTTVEPLSNGSPQRAADNYYLIQDGRADDSYSLCLAFAVKTKYKVSLDVTKAELAFYEEGSASNDVLALRAAVLPETAPDKRLSWSSSNSEAAAVNGNGVVTPHKAGTAVITVTAADGGAAASCDVTVRQKVTALGEPKFIIGSTNLGLIAGANDAAVIGVPVYPSSADNGELAWESTDENVIKVDQEGHVTAVGSGTATVVVRTTDGSGHFREITFTVFQPVTAIDLTTASGDRLVLVGGTKQITANILPDTATSRDVRWSIDGASRGCAVDQNGFFTASYDVGEVNVLCEALDGSKVKGNIALTVVRPKAVSINFVPAAVSLDNGLSLDLYANLNAEPKGALKPAASALNWSSSDPDAVSVNAEGVVTALKGDAAAVITAAGMADGAALSADCTVSTVATESYIKLHTMLAARPSEKGGSGPANEEKMTLAVYTAATHALLLETAASADETGLALYTLSSVQLDELNGKNVKLWIKGERYLAVLLERTVAVQGGVWEVSMDDAAVVGDTNGDNKCNGTDFLKVKSSMGTNKGDAGYNYLADLNNDGKVNALDFLKVKASMGGRGVDRPQSASSEMLAAAAREGALGAALGLDAESAAGTEALSAGSPKAARASSEAGSSETGTAGGGCRAGGASAALAALLPLMAAKRKKK
ncbi:MAG: Ig-like domain-containing protein [bacterium]|nr:Ig-like domain-containing protein [bacterium]